MAEKDFDKGEYRRIHRLQTRLYYADPENKTAHYVCADALEQLQLSAESGSENCLSYTSGETDEMRGQFVILPAPCRHSSARFLNTVRNSIHIAGLQLFSK